MLFIAKPKLEIDSQREKYSKPLSSDWVKFVIYFLWALNVLMVYIDVCVCVCLWMQWNVVIQKFSLKVGICNEQSWWVWMWNACLEKLGQSLLANHILSTYTHSYIIERIMTLFINLCTHMEVSLSYVKFTSGDCSTFLSIFSRQFHSFRGKWFIGLLVLHEPKVFFHLFLLHN